MFIGDAQFVLRNLRNAFHARTLGDFNVTGHGGSPLVCTLIRKWILWWKYFHAKGFNRL
jgi:hypothetical protein